ncbi:hypothetical protein PPACK8108_LOCUS14936, partial [Phakopsora pachyrhizi]
MTRTWVSVPRVSSKCLPSARALSTYQDKLRLSTIERFDDWANKFDNREERLRLRTLEKLFVEQVGDHQTRI